MRELEIPEGSAGLDAGCGIGQHALWLAERVGPQGRVTGLDISPENLAVARELACKSPLCHRVDFTEGNLLHMAFEDDSFDWAWCADTLWPVIVADDPVSGVRELARVVRPGGIVAVLYWSSQNLLPGYPILEARLTSASVATTPYLARVPPHLHFLRALGWLRAAGLQQPVARTCVAEVQPPFEPELREAMAFWFSMFWGNLEPHVSQEDWDKFQRLCDTGSDDFILNTHDYYGFLTYTVFKGQVA